MQFGIYLFACPREVCCVLSHFETRSSYTTCVHCFTRSKRQFVVLESLDSFRSTTHIRNFGNQLYFVCNQGLCIFFVEFVLESTRQSYIARDDPYFFAFYEFAFFGKLLGKRFYDILVRSTEFEHIVYHFVGHTVGYFYATVGTRQTDNFRSKLSSFLRSTPSNVTETGNYYALSFDGFFEFFQHVVYKVECTVTCCFGTNKRATPIDTFTCEYACVVFTGKFLVHTVHKTDFTTAYANVAGRNVRIGTDMMPQFEDECLAETHYFGIRFAHWVEVRTTLAAAHRQCSKSVFESLFEAQELQHRQVNSFVETDTAFVRSDSCIELYTITDVRLNFAFVVDPVYTESEDSVGFHHTFDDFCLCKFRVFVVNRFNRFQHFVYCL